MENPSSIILQTTCLETKNGIEISYGFRFLKNFNPCILLRQGSDWVILNRKQWIYLQIHAMQINRDIQMKYANDSDNYSEEDFFLQEVQSCHFMYKRVGDNMYFIIKQKQNGKEIFFDEDAFDLLCTLRHILSASFIHNELAKMEIYKFYTYKYMPLCKELNVIHLTVENAGKILPKFNKYVYHRLLNDIEVLHLKDAKNK